MSWSLTIERTPVEDFAGAVDAARATGEVATGLASLQITQAKAMLTALAASGALGSEELAAEAWGHGESPALFSVSVQEWLTEKAIEQPASTTAEPSGVAAPASGA